MIFIHFILTTSFMGYAMAACFGSNPPFALTEFSESSVTTGTWYVVRRTEPFTTNARCETRTYSGSPLNQLVSAYKTDTQEEQSVTTTILDDDSPQDGYYIENIDPFTADYRFIEVDGTACVVVYRCINILETTNVYIEILTQQDPIDNYEAVRTCGEAALTAQGVDVSGMIDIDHSDCADPTTTTTTTTTTTVRPSKWDELKQMLDITGGNIPFSDLLNKFNKNSARNVFGYFNQRGENVGRRF